MTLHEKIEASADLTLWCVHILGPDEIFAAPSHKAAVAHAMEINETIHKRGHVNDDLCFAYAAPWPHGRADHTEDVKDWMKDT